MTLVSILFTLIGAIVGIALAVYLYYVILIMYIFDDFVYLELWWNEFVNLAVTLWRLPGRGFVRAMHGVRTFSDARIRPTLYALHYSALEGKLNTWAHTLMRTKKKVCPICYDRTFKHRIHRFRNCEHEACTSCVREYISTQIDSGKSEFQCPLGEACDTLAERVVHNVTRVDLELRDKVERMYVRVALAACVDEFHCPSTECGNAVFSDIEIDESNYRLSSHFLTFEVLTAFAADLNGSDLRKFKCVNCGYSYCVLCSRVWDQGNISHNQRTCTKYQRKREKANQVTQAYVRQELNMGTLKRCPSCNTPIEKNGGCAHMHCTNCDHHFCWHCMRDYPQQCQGYCAPSVCTVM